MDDGGLVVRCAQLRVHVVKKARPKSPIFNHSTVFIQSESVSPLHALSLFVDLLAGSLTFQIFFLDGCAVLYRLYRRIDDEFLKDV
jgi:hypothetical protein